MPDPYASISEKDEALQSKLADVLELRASDPRQKEMLDSFLRELHLKKDSAVLEVGCGTGAICREILKLDEVRSVTGIDPSPVFISYANRLSEGDSNISFQTADARHLDYPDASFDAVVFYTTLSHIPSAELALREACRVLRPGGTLAIFDGDYTTATVATGEYDPLQVAVDAMVRNFVENVWLARALPKLIKSCGLTLENYNSHGYTKVQDPSYFLTLIERGADILTGMGTMGTEQAGLLKSEAMRRVEQGEFFGHITYVSAISRKPG